MDIVPSPYHLSHMAMPQVMPPYFAADTLIGGFTEHAPWPLWTWWDKSLPLKKA